MGIHRNGRGGRSGGFTLAELLVVVGILGILAAIAIPTVASISRKSHMATLDKTAENIYTVVQNRLSELSAQGQMSKDGAIVSAIEGEHAVISSRPSDYPDDGVDWASGSTGGKLNYGLYYLQSSDDSNTEYLVTDETALGIAGLGDGSYVIELSPETGEVYSVFYSEDPGLTYAECPTSDRSLSNRTELGIGYYRGGALSQIAANEKSALPDISFEVTNREELYVSIYPFGKNGTADASVLNNQRDLVLTVTVMDAAGNSWKKTLAGGTDFNLTPTDSRVDCILDSMSSPDLHFASLKDSSGKTTVEDGITPGEDITVSVSASYGSEAFDNTTNASLANKKANSLFGDISYDSNGTGTCAVSSVRHLNNLRSGYFSATSYATATGKKVFSSIEQTGDIIFSNWDAAAVSKLSLQDGTVSNPLQSFAPIESDSVTLQAAYDGKGNSISGFVIDGTGDTGLFASKAGLVSNLVLAGFQVTGTGASTGVLAGACSATVKNVYARDCNVTGMADTGGFVGSASNATFTRCGVYLSDDMNASIVQGDDNTAAGGFAGWCEGDTSFSYCFAAEPVSGFSYVGGFIGSSTARGSITGCYSSGATSASNSIAGGFAARLACAVSSCYSTSNVSSADGAAGFICIAGVNSSNTSQATITACRSYGSISSDAAAGFVDSIESGASVSDCTYLSMYGYNVFEASDGNTAASFASMKTAAASVSDSHPYSSSLSGKAFPFALCTDGTDVVAHYGDWPAGISITWRYDDGTNGGAILKTYELLSGSSGPAYYVPYWANAKDAWLTDGYDPMPHKDRDSGMNYAVYRFTGFSDFAVDADGNQTYYAQFENFSYEQIAQLLIDDTNSDNTLWSKYLDLTSRAKNSVMTKNASVDSEFSISCKDDTRLYNTGKLAQQDERELTYLSKRGIYIDQISFRISVTKDTYTRLLGNKDIGYNKSNKGYSGNFMIYVSSKIDASMIGTSVDAAVYDVGLASQGQACYSEGTMSVVMQSANVGSGLILKTPVLASFKSN